MSSMDSISSLSEQQDVHSRGGKSICDIFSSSPQIPFIASDCQWHPLSIQKEKLQTAGADSFDWILCYSDDIYRHWRNMEQKRMIVKPFPDLFAFRTSTITIVRNLVAKCNMANATLHLAIYIMDNFLSRTDVQGKELKLVTVSCFLIAAKFEDVNEKLPLFAELNKTILDNAFTLSDYKNLEAKILICLNFDLTIPTIATFANFFSRISVILEEFFLYQQWSSYDTYTLLILPTERNVSAHFAKYEDMLEAINTLAFRLIDFTLDSVKLINVLPSCKAVSCIAAARSLYNIKPMWSLFLEAQTQYTETEIRPFVEIIINLYEARIINTLTTSNLETVPEDCIPLTTANAAVPPITYQKPFLLDELTT